MATTNFKNSAGADIGSTLVERSYLTDRYPELADTFRFAGLWLWGTNFDGRLGNGNVTKKSSPVQTVSGGTNWKSMASGTYSSAAIKTDGTLWLWGLNWYGRIGDNTRTQRNSPVQTVSGGTNWKMVASGYYHTAAIKTDGTLWTWGYNNNGQLGDNTRTHKSSPVQTVSGGTNWKQVACGRGHTSGIKTDGTLWLWGSNGNCELGDNTTDKKSSPVQTVAGGTNWKLVAGGFYHTAAIKTDGTLWTWGENTYGGLGDDTGVAKSSPVQTVSGGTNWKQVAGGNAYTAAIKTDGTLWLWGYNNYGKLGDNTTIIIHPASRQSSPIQTVSGGTNWKQVSCGKSHTAAIKTDGTLWLWGDNSYAGYLGDNTRTHKSSPIQTVSGGTNWKQVAAGDSHTGAIRDDSSDEI